MTDTTDSYNHSSTDQVQFDETATEESPFVTLFTDKNVVRVLDALSQYNYEASSVQDISDRTGLSENTVTEVVELLTNIDLVTCVNEPRREYQINPDTPFSRGLDLVRLALLGTLNRESDSN